MPYGQEAALFCLVSAFGFVVQVLLSLAGAWQVQALLYLMFYVAGGVLLVRWFGFFDPRSLFFLSFGVYAGSGPLDTLIYVNSLALDAQRQSISLYYSTLFLLCLVVAISLGEGRKGRAPMAVENTGERRALWAFLILLGVLCFAYFILAEAVYGWSVVRRSRMEIYANKSVALDLFRLGFSACAVFAAWTLRRASATRGHYYALAALVGAFGWADMLFIGDRKLVVGVIFGVMFVSLFGRSVALRTYMVIGALIVLMIVFGRIRSTPMDQWTSTVQTGFTAKWLNPATSEFGGFAMLSDAYIVDHTELTEMRPTYLQAALCLVPKAIYPDRPLSPTEWAAKTYFPAVYRQGGSRAFNAVIESMLNLWIFGPLLVGFLWGRLLTAMAVWARRPVGLLVVGVMMQVLLFAARTSFVTYIRSAILLLTVTAALHLVHEMLFANTGTRIRLGNPRGQEPLPSRTGR
ncbi:hypothetical protein ABI59_06170 [Acidobacteria bacterium Mor1]|nr:hypothetical protein ABI59_06170 [Acidobacteria bacterium Mor1]